MQQKQTPNASAIAAHPIVAESYDPSDPYSLFLLIKKIKLNTNLFSKTEILMTFFLDSQRFCDSVCVKNSWLANCIPLTNKQK